MKPAAAEHLLFLDYFRGVAILSVFLLHSLFATFGTDRLAWNGWFFDWHVGKSLLILLPATFGWVGVPIFFTISGFCIHLSHQRSRQKGFTAFFLRRFFRIYPPYLATYFFFAFLFPPTRLSSSAGAFSSSVEELLSHIFLVHNFTDHFFFGKVVGALWTIAIEVQLYLLYPLLLAVASRWGWQKTLLLTAMIEVSMRGSESLVTFLQPEHHTTHLLTGSPFYFWFSWTSGAALAEAWLKNQPLPFRDTYHFIWPVLLVGAYFFRPFYPFLFTLAALTSVWVMAFLLERRTYDFTASGWKKYALDHLRWAGVVSYSAYLIHQPLLNAIAYRFSMIHGHKLPSLLLYVICLLAWFPIFGLSYLCYRYLELPGIAWGKRIIAQRQATAL